jgi:hypothetical protein
VNFTATTWMSAEGVVSFHSDALHIVERYRRADADTLVVDRHHRGSKGADQTVAGAHPDTEARAFDQIMQIGCSGVETRRSWKRPPSRRRGRSRAARRGLD